jgi:hypothetical protein
MTPPDERVRTHKLVVIDTEYTVSCKSNCHKTDRHDITELLLKVALNTITLTPCLRQIQIRTTFGLEYFKT